MPLASGSRAILAGSSPVMQAAAWSTRPAVEPPVTSAAGASSMRAMAAPAAAFSSSMFTWTCAASRMASMVSGRMREPP